jgi:PAS domain S-box-containing protein
VDLADARPLRLLVVEDSDDDYAILLRELHRAGHAPHARRVSDGAQLAAALDEPWDLLVTDWMLPGFGGLAALELVEARGLDLPAIVISGTPNEEAAVEALRAGALDFLSKDKPSRFVTGVERALREAGLRRAREAAEHELRLSEERYRAAFEAAPEALGTYDLDDRCFVDANANLQHLFGLTAEQLRVQPLGGISAERQADGQLTVDVAPAVIERVRRGETQVLEWRFRDATGEEFPAELRLALLPSSGHQLLRVSVIDLRERRRLEDIRRRAVELELQNRRIQEANRLKSEFLANMSHELRTPLNAIIGFSELLHDGQVDPASPQHREFLGDILTSGRHLLQLINDVLDLAKVEAGKLDLRPEPVDPARLVTEVISVTRTAAASKQVQVRGELDVELGSIVIDPSRFTQIAYNFLSNALKFTPEGGRVTVRLLPEGNDAFRLEVEDTGVGIAPADLGRLFVEFEQLDHGAGKRHQGTGLGLALTRRLAEAQGGSVGVRSTPGQGSVFHATLPRRATSADRAACSPIESSSPRRHTVLVVEDDDRDREVITSVLEGAGYGVVVARTGAEALARCRERTFDAVTLDLVQLRALLPEAEGV